MKLNRLTLAVGFVAMSVVTGCHCGARGTTNGAYGAIGVVYSDSTGQVHTDTNATYDFGPVFMGQSATMPLVVKNLGAGALTLSTLTKTSGDPTTIAGVGDPNPDFNVDFSGGATLEAGEVGQYTITFNALQDTATTVPHEVQLLLTTQGAQAGQNTAVITIKGTAVSGVCQLPTTLDFGSVQVGDSYTMSININNPTQLDAQATLGAIYSSSGDDAAFTFTADSPRGTFTVPAGTSKAFKIAFSPTQVHKYVAFLKAQASVSCPEVAMTLQGAGVTQVLTWAPTTVDCGDVQPGSQVTQTLTFTNAGNVDANLSQIQTGKPAEFFVVPATGMDPTTAVVPGKGGTTTLTIGCKPAGIGPRNDTLTFNTSLPRQPSGSVPLKVFGGGPVIQVTPFPNLSFGTVAYFSTAMPPSFQTRKLTVMNVGALTPTAAGNLYLGQNNGSGSWGTPYVNVTPGAGTMASEITVTVPSSYNPSQGLPAQIGQNSVDLVVTVTPQSVGTKTATVTIYSSDPANPSVTVNVSADAELLPPCDYSFAPSALNFGLITPPSYHDLSFNIVNNSQVNTCLLSNLDLAPNTDPTFTLPAGPIASYTMMPGEVKTILVRAWPQGAVPPSVTAVAGAVQFYMSSPTQPQGTVNLAATVGSSCLTIAPASLDFGTVQKGCNSATRTFSIYNTCSTAVTINDFKMQSAGGEPAGGPDCPAAGNPSGCPAFFLTSTPAIPAGGLLVNPGAAPITFQAKYAPVFLGADTGAIELDAVQGGATVVYLVNLKGNGDTQGKNTDVFTQQTKPEADILICDDSSCSMTDKQTALANNFNSFLMYATSAQVDFQIAVVTEEVSTSPTGCITGNVCDGQFVNYLNEGLILTPNTPNLPQAFGEKVQVQAANHSTSGDLEQCITTTAEAITPPLVTGPNAGFLRPQASLAVVTVSDAYDQGTQPISFFLNEFLNAKGNQSNLFTFNSIGDFNDEPMTTPGCVYEAGESPDEVPNQPSGVTGRYLQMVNSTNGVRGGVCDQNWAATLQNIGKTAFGFRTNFFLNAVPDLTGGKTIDVQIDGMDIPQTASAGGTIWSYDPVANSVDFNPLYVPQPGQTLTITYYVACY